MFKVKKVFFYIIKVFYEPEPERYSNCIYCKGDLTGSQRKFCSISCSNKYHHQLYSGKKKKDVVYTPISKEKRELDTKKHRARMIAYKTYPSLKKISCEFCEDKAVHRHHEDYDKPKEVNFLCWSCHGKVHSGLIQM